jgi:hypothetical protein
VNFFASSARVTVGNHNAPKEETCQAPSKQCGSFGQGIRELQTKAMLVAGRHR